MSILDNQQPALSLNESLALFGIFPSFGGGGFGMTMAMFHTYAFGFNPGGAAIAQGQLLPINQNQALFSLLGTQYGGNGQTNFQLPNLNGRQLTGSDDGTVGTLSGSATSSFLAQNYPTSIGGAALPLNEDGPSLEARYFIATQGIFPPRDGGGTSLAFLGSIVKAAYNGTPGGYLPCEGQLLSIAQNTALFSLLGTTYGGNGTTNFALPDLRGKTLIGTGTDPVSGITYGVGEIVGQNGVTVTNANLPTNMGGQGQLINNFEPSVAVNFYISPVGIFPNNGGGGAPDSETPFVGEIMAFAGTFVPGGGIACDGRLLSIAEFDVLFALIGTTYGGDGQTTFAVPDLRGRSIVGLGSNNVLGQTVGNTGFTLTSADFGDLNYSGTDAAGTHFGGDGNDKINALGGADAVSGGIGNDTIIGGAGGDTMDGGANSVAGDTLSFETSLRGVAVDLLTGLAEAGDAEGDSFVGFENITGSAQGDQLVGDDGANVLTGGAGNDLFVGNLGADTLIGGADLDVVDYSASSVGVTVNLTTGAGPGGDVISEIENITGSAFGDVLIGDNGANTMRGGVGNDFFVAGNGADLLIGGADNDEVSYETATTGVFVNLITGTGANGGVLQQIENIRGSTFGDALQGDNGANTIRGLAGNDYIIAGNGADLIIGGADNDTVSYETAITGVFANLATGVGANGGVLQEIENLTGSAFGDVLIGNVTGNTLKGGAGNDFIVGNNGSDALFGGADNDTFRFETAAFGNDVIADYQDNADKMSFGNLVATSFGQLNILNNGTTNVTVQIIGQSIVVQGAANITLTAGDFLFV